VTDRTTLATEGISLEVLSLGGILSNLCIARNGREVRPLHRAAWVDRPETVPEGAPPHLRYLEGDFLCAPFGAPAKGSAAPPHGWTANGQWTLVAEDAAPDGAKTLRFKLGKTVEAASVEKRVSVRPGHPFVYQEHSFSRCAGEISLSHHAMVAAPGGMRLSFSPKKFGRTPEAPLDPPEKGTTFLLRYPQQFESLADVELADGTQADLRSYPAAKKHEDFLTLYDEEKTAFGWSAAVAQRDGFVFVGLKDAAVLSQTSLWMSNGGRTYAPWNGVHENVLGIEEGCSGYSAGSGGNLLPVRTALWLDRPGGLTVRYALGAIPLPEGFREVAAVEISANDLVLQDVGGARETLPFDVRFFDNNKVNQ